ncbi:Hypothetical protein LUCI_3454 [Lucifera butyrica]|uniref:histidine kinase n=1 Tax=Lucifera butyrica TaxID=1351585 RepID=A0A498R624_9FIRM|nr:HAMP domain-containing sensor histidine kinase [Lucifera butyrica]VBB08186.1 Hypothetical protein LUCI_3454 [Lucifera butyrica]
MDHCHHPHQKNIPPYLRRKYHRDHFLRHYKYFRFLRPVTILFNLTIFYLLFIWANNKGLVIFFGSVIIIKEILHFFFLLRFDRKTIKPMIKIKQGLDEVAKGNYNVKIDYGMPNDIAIVIDSFNEMTAKLYESEKIKSEYEENRKALIANISHDLKTPITSIQGYVEALLENAPGSAENRYKYLQTIYHNTVYVNKLIDDLFLFAKLDMQKLEFQYQNTKIRAFMDDLMEEYRFDFSERNIEFHYHADSLENVLVQLDGKRFRQAVNNIINNAILHGPAEGLLLSITLYRQNDFVSIDIKDNGPGISDEKLPFIFDRFYRIHSERPKEITGTGLGLAIAKELIEAHCGKITVSSTVNEGSCFTVRLPILNEESEAYNETHPDH